MDAAIKLLKQRIEAEEQTWKAAHRQSLDEGQQAVELEWAVEQIEDAVVKMREAGVDDSPTPGGAHGPVSMLALHAQKLREQAAAHREAIGPASATAQAHENIAAKYQAALDSLEKIDEQRQAPRKAAPERDPVESPRPKRVRSKQQVAAANEE